MTKPLQVESIFLAVDASSFAESATRYAAYVSQRLQLPLSAVHILDSRLAAIPSTLDAGVGDMSMMLPEYNSGVEEVLEEQSQEIKAKTEKRLSELGVKVALEVRAGLPAEEIVGAIPHDALCVLGKQGESAEFGGSPRLGGVAERVVRRAEGAVLLTPETFTEPKRLLLGYDGSEGAEGALEVALVLSERLALPLVALSVHDDPAEAEAQLAEVRERARRDGLRLSTQALSGKPVEAILGATEPGDVIAIGAFGAGRLAEFFGGSTTSHIVRGAEVPVLLHS